MKKLSCAVSLLLVLSVCFFITGCTSKDDLKASSKKEIGAPVTSTDENKDSSATGTFSDKDKSKSRSDDYTDEEKATMANLTGTWESRTSNEDGTITVIKAKIDNISGFTLTTGTTYSDGKSSYYSYVGSYSLKGDEITFNATTGGESTDGESYQLRQDSNVFKYDFKEDTELTQITLTPINDKATALTGPDPVILKKA